MKLLKNYLNIKKLMYIAHSYINESKSRLWIIGIIAFAAFLILSVTYFLPDVMDVILKIILVISVLVGILSIKEESGFGFLISLGSVIVFGFTLYHFNENPEVLNFVLFFIAMIALSLFVFAIALKRNFKPHLLLENSFKITSDVTTIKKVLMFYREAELFEKLDYFYNRNLSNALDSKHLEIWKICYESIKKQSVYQKSGISPDLTKEFYEVIFDSIELCEDLAAKTLHHRSLFPDDTEFSDIVNSEIDDTLTNLRSIKEEFEKINIQLSRSLNLPNTHIENSNVDLEYFNVKVEAVKEALEQIREVIEIRNSL